MLQIFQEEQTEYARAVGDVDLVAENLPQFETIASGLYKHRNYSDYNLTKVENRFLLSQTKVKNGSNDTLNNG